MKIMEFYNKSYREVWNLQKATQAHLINQKIYDNQSIEEAIIAGEHLPVYTIGFHGDMKNLLFGLDDLQNMGYEVIRIERGGDITYHGPGQLTVYPIINLYQHGIGVKQYVNILEEAVIRLLKKYEIRGERIEGATGVWIGKGSKRERKICAIGIKVSRGVTLHGFALNVNTDLKAFDVINPCGFIDKGVTSMAEEKKEELDIMKVKQQLIEILLSLLK